MAKENQAPKSRKASKQSRREKSRGVSSKTINSMKFVSCEVENKKLLSTWKPINTSLINMLQRIQHNHAVPIFINESSVGKEASTLIRTHQKDVISQCQDVIGPNMKFNFHSLKKDIITADEQLEILKSKVEYLDSQILREQRRLDTLKDTVEVVKQ